MSGPSVVRVYARKRLRRRELARLLRLTWHGIVGHDWSRWRIETEDWFEYVDGPVPRAWRACRRGCGAIEHVGRELPTVPPGFRGIGIAQEGPVGGGCPEPGGLPPAPRDRP